MAVVLLAAAAGILRSPLPDLRASDANAAAALAGETEGRSVFSFPHLWLGVDLACSSTWAWK